MRKYALLAAAAGLGLSGSLARADFVLTSQRVQGSQFDTVSFFVKDTQTGTTTGSQGLNEVDAAIYAPGAGLVVGPVSATNSRPDIFGINSANQASESFINFGSGDLGTPGSPTGGSVLVSNGSGGFTHTTQAATTGITLGTLVPGIAGTWFIAGDSVTDTSPVKFAQAVVPHGETVEILSPASPHPDATWEPVATSFSSSTAVGGSIFLPSDQNATAPFVDAVPEPASFGLLALAGGLMLRRRRS